MPDLCVAVLNVYGNIRAGRKPAGRAVPRPANSHQTALTACPVSQVMRPLRLYKWFAALCLLGCAVAAESPPPVLVLNVTYYDFRVHEDIHNNPVTHPDFERSCHPGPRSFDPCVGEKGLVEEKLGWDGRRRAWHRA